MRERLQKLAQRAQQTMPARVLMAYGESQASNYALALAFAGFMAMFPLMLGALSIIGLAIRDPQTEARFTLLVLQVFPSSAQPELQSALHGVKESAGWLGLVSFAGLIWSASSIFSTMEFALTEIFGTKQRDMLRQRLMGLVMMVVLVVAIVITVLIDAGGTFAGSYIGWGKSQIVWTVSFVAGALVMTTLLVILYRFVPNRSFKLKQVLPGAILSGVLLELLSFAFPLYAKVAGGFNTYGAQFGLFFLLATWFYLLSQLVLLGAVYNRLRLGDPATLGLIASPSYESREKARPVQAIERTQTAPQPGRRRVRRSLFQAGAILALGSLALLSRLVRRKRVRTAP